MHRGLLAITTLTIWIASAVPSIAQGTLDKIKSRGHVACGTSQGVPGFSMPDATGNWTGFDTDFCGRSLQLYLMTQARRDTSRYLVKIGSPPCRAEKSMSSLERRPGR
jgi:hypothetical protein